MSIYAQVFTTETYLTEVGANTVLNGAIFIGIYDADSGDFTNGNGIPVTYEVVNYNINNTPAISTNTYTVNSVPPEPLVVTS